MYNTTVTQKRAAIYARVSTEHEAQILALGNQLEWYDEWLKYHPEYKEVKRYVDEGITGTSAKKRKGFTQMIADAEAGKFDVILTREVSRFARNTEEVLKYVRKLKKINVAVHFINDSIITDNPDGELRLTIMAAVAQDESRKLSERVKCGQAVSMQNGILYGNGNILGYNRNNPLKELVVDEEQAKTVRQIFKWYIEGWGIRRIQFELERAGYKTSTGKDTWHSGTISHILQNPFYCGRIVYRKEFVADFLEQKKERNYGQVPQIVVKGSHTPLVSEEDFDKVQRIMDSHRRELPNLQTGKLPGGVRNKVDVWSKLLRCSCGHSFNRRKWNRKANGEKTYSYQCYDSLRTGTVRTRQNKGLSLDGICTAPVVPQWKLKMMAKTVFKDLISDCDNVLNLANQMVKDHISDKKEVEDNSAIIESLTMKIKSLENRLDGYMDMRADGEITKEKFAEHKSKIDSEIAILNKQIAEYEIPMIEETSNDEDVTEKLKMIEYALEQYTLFDDDGDIPDGVIEAFVEKVVVSDKGFDWYLYINPDIPYSYSVKGKRSGTAEVVSASSPLVDNKNTPICHIQHRQLSRISKL